MDIYPPTNVKPIGSYPRSGIDVVIIGTGLAGLTAAIECVRKGHNVQVLEREAEEESTAGDMVLLGLSAIRFMKHWPEMAEEYSSISMHNVWVDMVRFDGSQMNKQIKMADRWIHETKDPNIIPRVFHLRPLLFKMLLRQARKVGIKILFNHRVVDYLEDEGAGKAGVTTERGERFIADIVIAADGIGSKSQSLVGGQVRAAPSGRAIWRSAFPTVHLMQNPEVKEYFSPVNETEPVLRRWYSPAGLSMTLSRADTMVLVVNHDVTGTETEDWHQRSDDSQELLEHLDKMEEGPMKWTPIFRKFVKCIPPKALVNFNILWRNPKPSWASPGSRVIQIGDCAHSYFPASGAGATMAMEDAVALASCLQLGGKDNIPEVVQAYIRFRFIRNACCQKLGFSNAEMEKSRLWQMQNVKPEKVTPLQPKWIWTHDVEAYVDENYNKAVESIRKGVAMEDEAGYPPNYPVGYKYTPWTIEEIMDDLKMGKQVDLGPGEWY